MIFFDGCQVQQDEGLIIFTAPAEALLGNDHTMGWALLSVHVLLRLAGDLTEPSESQDLSSAFKSFRIDGLEDIRGSHHSGPVIIAGSSRNSHNQNPKPATPQ